NFRTSTEMFSDEQVSWMKGLRLAKQSFLMTGSQFFGAYLKKDSFEGTYPQAFKNFLVQLGQMPSRFVLASGDIHFSEVMKIESEALGYETYEITSSSIHSLTMPGSHVIRPRNPRRIPGLVTSTHNFLTLEWDTYRSD